MFEADHRYKTRSDGTWMQGRHVIALHLFTIAGISNSSTATHRRIIKQVNLRRDTSQLLLERELARMYGPEYPTG
jgi:hypothetical protein